MVDEIKNYVERVIVPNYPIKEFRVASNQDQHYRSKQYKIKVVYQIPDSVFSPEIYKSLENQTKMIFKILGLDTSLVPDVMKECYYYFVVVFTIVNENSVNESVPSDKINNLENVLKTYFDSYFDKSKFVTKKNLRDGSLWKGFWIDSKILIGSPADKFQNGILFSNGEILNAWKMFNMKPTEFFEELKNYLEKKYGLEITTVL